MKKSFILILTLVLIISVSGEDIKGEESSKLLTEEQLKKEAIYASLEEALKNPLKVYKLDLSGKQLTQL